MRKPIILLLAVLFYITAQSQNDYLLLKKKQQGIQRFWKDSHITFQTSDGQWITGIITKITNDSFYFTQEIIHYYLMGSDTQHFSGFRFSINDIRVLPTSRQMLVYHNEQVSVIPGHEKFMWVRNGFIFQAAGAGYVGLNIINDLINNDPPFAKKNLGRLGIGAGVFLIGTLLHLHFDPYIRIGKKYSLQCVVIPSAQPM